MKIGILTFHSQLNYGGVLQCLALQQYLTQCGHDVKIIDRWLTRNNSPLYGPFVYSGLRALIRECLNFLLLAGWRRGLLRYIRTIDFVRSKLKLTDYHFFKWYEAPVDLGLDCVVVGSDQVWNCEFQDPSTYLLNGAPAINAIAYAASIGMQEIPSDKMRIFREGLQRFSAISVREKQSSKILSPLLPCDNTVSHVVDPTLLLARDDWYKIVPLIEKKKKIVCYFLGLQINEYIDQISEYCGRNNCEAEIFVNPTACVYPEYFKKCVKENLVEFKAIFGSRVKIMRSAGPIEFLKSIASAKLVITDSFHAIMFSYIYQCDVRAIRAKSGDRVAMFARIDELIDRFVSRDIVVDSIHAALRLFTSGQHTRFYDANIRDERIRSMEWLRESLKTVAIDVSNNCSGVIHTDT